MGENDEFIRVQFLQTLKRSSVLYLRSSLGLRANERRSLCFERALKERILQQGRKVIRTPATTLQLSWVYLWDDMNTK